jgi:chromosome partitioning protein
MSAAPLVVTPAVLATKELDALEGMLEELADYPLLVVPNRVPPCLRPPRLSGWGPWPNKPGLGSRRR